MARLPGARTLALMALAQLWVGPVAAQTASCSEAEGSSIFSAYSAFQESVSADCAADKCAQTCLDTQRLLSTALPDCTYVDGVNYHQQVLDFIAACDATEAPTVAPVASADPVASVAPVAVDPAVETVSPEVIQPETPVAIVTDPSTTPAAPTSGSQATAVTCTTEQGESILETYGTHQGNLSLACAADKCASTCVLAQTEVLALLPDCLYADGANYHAQVSAALAACGVDSTGDVGFVASPLPCSVTQSNVTVILYSQYEDELRDACDEDQCSSDCISIVNQLASVLPDCVYSDGVNYRNESIGIIDNCTAGSTTGSGSVVGPESAASSLVTSMVPMLAGLAAVVAVAL